MRQKSETQVRTVSCDPSLARVSEVDPVWTIRVDLAKLPSLRTRVSP